MVDSFDLVNETRMDKAKYRYSNGESVDFKQKKHTIVYEIVNNEGG